MTIFECPLLPVSLEWLLWNPLAQAPPFSAEALCQVPFLCASLLSALWNSRCTGVPWAHFPEADPGRAPLLCWCAEESQAPRMCCMRPPPHTTARLHLPVLLTSHVGFCLPGKESLTFSTPGILSYGVSRKLSPLEGRQTSEKSQPECIGAVHCAALSWS